MSRFLLSLFTLLALTGRAHADDKARAAEHFALAESAEARQDWRTAIREYTAAFDIAPHPSVIYNIALDHERLGELREAGMAFLRYIDLDPSADDRDEVLAKVKALRESPAPVDITAVQGGVTILIDGEERGAAPLHLVLPGGNHSVQGQKGDILGASRSVYIEYGTPVQLSLDVQTLPGSLSVFTREKDVSVFIDGTLAGHSPYHGQVGAGTHKVVLRALGYQSEEREVVVPSQGSAQVRAALDRTPGTGAPGDTGDKSSNKAATNGFLLDGGYGWQGSGFRYAFNVGGRLADGSVDATVGLGYFGTELGGGFSGNLRYYFSTAALRPYARASFLLGKGPSTSTSDERIFAAEAAGGVLFAPPKRAKSMSYSYQYFVELGVQAVLNPPSDDSVSGSSSSSSLSIPILLGLVFAAG